MIPAQHMLIGWIAAEVAGSPTRRERATIAICSMAPDLDGFGYFAERLTEHSTHPLTWFSDYHHVLAHNVFFGLFITVAAYFFIGRSIRGALLVVMVFHLHLLGDIISGRSNGGDYWGIAYFTPLWKGEWNWSGQWALSAWPNYAIYLISIIAVATFAIKRGRTPVEIISKKLDESIVQALRAVVLPLAHVAF